MSKPTKVVPEKVRGFKAKSAQKTYTDIQPMLYALSIGFNQDPLNVDHFNFTYEFADNFTTFPTFGVVCHNIDIFSCLQECPGLPDFNPMMLLHGEQKIEIFKQLPTSGTVINEATIVDVADKGSGALLSIEITTSSESKEVYVKQTNKIFIRGLGGFGDKGKAGEVLPTPPKRSPDAVSEEKTEPNQALYYRLNSDRNPLHVDPNMSAMGGFEKPILHGLCTFGFTARAVYEKYGNGNPNCIRVVNGRFTSHVIPGETLVVSMFKDGDRVMFVTSTKERQKPALVGYVDLAPAAKL